MRSAIRFGSARAALRGECSQRVSHEPGKVTWSAWSAWSAPPCLRSSSCAP